MEPTLLITILLIQSFLFGLMMIELTTMMVIINMMSETMLTLMIAVFR